jgi:uncharacterized protein (TIGR03000 family)
MVQLKLFCGLALAAALVLVGNTSAHAWHYHSHGSYGSCGSSGGSYGSWGSHGSSGGSYSHGSSGGFFGHHGSSGGFFSHGSSGSSGSSGNYGSYGSSGSSGGVVGAASAEMPTSTAVVAVPVSADRAQLILNVPADAVVYLSNQRMTLEGTTREFTVPGLTAGMEYRYPVRVEVVRDGQTLTANADQQLQAGQRLNLAFNQTAGQSEIVALRN